MQKYINKVTGDAIEAAQVTYNTAEPIAKWCGGRVVDERDAITSAVYKAVNVPTEAGNRRASDGCYVIYYDDRFWVNDAGRFEHGYEPSLDVEFSEEEESTDIPRQRKKPTITNPFGDPNED